MPTLSDARIYRGGVTAPGLTYETHKCSFRSNTGDNSLDLSFNLKSKGGGTTRVLLQIGLHDMPRILESIATTFPESVGVLSDCAAMANKRNLEQLEIARKVNADESARAKSLIDDLNPVEELVSEKFMELPAGEDEREEMVKDQLDKVIHTLRQLRDD